MAADNASERRAERMKLIVADCPCDTCQYRLMCTESGWECFSFHRWTATGLPQPPTQDKTK